MTEEEMLSGVSMGDLPKRTIEEMKAAKAQIPVSVEGQGSYNVPLRDVLTTAEFAANANTSAVMEAHEAADDPHPQYALDTDLSAHMANVNNPHGVTAAQVGLGNVDNTSDVAKPVSTAQQIAIDASMSGHVGTADPHPQYIRGTEIGVTVPSLENGAIPRRYLPGSYNEVQYYDALEDFPVVGEPDVVYVARDTAMTYMWGGETYAALNASLALGDTSQTAGRGDWTKAAFEHSQAQGNPHGLTKSDLSLGNVDNTADQDKPVSTATASAIAGLTKRSELPYSASSTGAFYCHVGTLTFDVGANDALTLAFSANFYANQHASHGFIFIAYHSNSSVPLIRWVKQWSLAPTTSVIEVSGDWNPTARTLALWAKMAGGNSGGSINVSVLGVTNKDGVAFVPSNTWASAYPTWLTQVVGKLVADSTDARFNAVALSEDNVLLANKYAPKDVTSTRPLPFSPTVAHNIRIASVTLPTSQEFHIGFRIFLYGFGSGGVLMEFNGVSRQGSTGLSMLKVLGKYSFPVANENFAVFELAVAGGQVVFSLQTFLAFSYPDVSVQIFARRASPGVVVTWLDEAYTNSAPLCRDTTFITI